jgi:hypothetical protein
MSENVVVTRSLEIDGWTVRVDEDDTPRIRDLDLAVSLGYEHPANIRKIIRGQAVGKKLNDSDIFSVTEFNSGRGRPAVTYWLTEEQALFVMAKSGTAKANAMLGQVIRVFVAARKGLLPQQQPQPIIDYDALAKAVVEANMAVMVPMIVRATRDALAAQSVALHRDPDPSVPKSYLASIKESIHFAACYRVSSGASPSMKSAKAKVESDLRSHLKWFGRGAQLKTMPTDLAIQALNYAKVLLADERQRAKAIEETQAIQLDLSLGDPTKKSN